MKHILLFILLILAFHTKAQETIRFTVSLAEETATEKIYDFIVDDFDDLIAWQLAMRFDTAGMRYLEIRNSVIEGMSSQNFFEADPGLIYSTWVDSDIVPNDYPNPVTAFQMVFELKTPGGSNLCFSLDSLDYEIVVGDGLQEHEVEQLVISDDCNSNYVIILNTPTAVVDANKPKQTIGQPYLSTDGLLSFTTGLDQILEINLFDVTGRSLTSISRNAYSQGRHSVESGMSLMEGVYFIQFRSKDGQQTTLGVMTF